MATILAIETSCDETAAAVVRDRTVLSSVVASQVAIHQRYGGVVPEVASRQHLEAINPCVEQALTEAQIDWSAIEAVAATVAPGLVGALLVGMAAAKTLAIAQRKPFLGVHHLEGHVCASYLDAPELRPPFLCLLVSGGHTSLIGVRAPGDYEPLGATRDDAAGEAFDKVARLLQLGYPGGPAIDRCARAGNPQAFPFPEGKVSRPGGGYYPYDFSFSGLKTAVKRTLERLDEAGEAVAIADVAASFQDTVARTLATRTLACAREHGFEAIAVGGGVAANSALRHYLQTGATGQGVRVYFPPLSLCTDNAAMIGCAAAERFARGQRSPLTLTARSRLPLTELDVLYEPLAVSEARAIYS